MDTEILKRIIFRLIKENGILKRQIRYDLKTAISKSEKDLKEKK